MFPAGWPAPQFAPLDDFRLAYRTWAEGPETIVLLHGVTRSASTWVRVAPALSETGRYRVVAPDLKGHGHSGQPAAGYRLDEQAGEIRQFCDHLGLDRLILAGHSWGGALAVLAAAAMGDRITCLVLEDPVLLLPEPHAIRAAESYSEGVGLSEKVVRLRVGQGGSGWTGVDVEAKVGDAVRASPAAVRAVFTINQPWDVRPALATVRCPTLLLQADPALGGVVPDVVLQPVRSGMSQVRIVTFSGVGHNIHISAFSQFMAEVQRFLSE